MKKSSLIFIEHILENIEDIELFTKKISRRSFLSNKEKQNAVIRSLEIIGEAAKHIPQSIRKKYAKIPWREITGTRDKIIHHYFGVDLELIWKIVKESLPGLKKEMLIVRMDLK